VNRTPKAQRARPGSGRVPSPIGLRIQVHPGASGPAGIPLPTLTIVSRSARGCTRYCIAWSWVHDPGLPCYWHDAALRAGKVFTAPLRLVSCSPRPILVTGSCRPGNAC